MVILSWLRLCITYPRTTCRHFRSGSRRVLHNNVYGIHHLTSNNIHWFLQMFLKNLFLQKEVWCGKETKLPWAIQPVDVMRQAAAMSLSLFARQGIRSIVYCVWPRPPELYLRCSGSVTEWHRNVQDTTEIAEKLKLCVVDTSLKIFVVLQRDLVLFKISFPPKICNSNMTDVLYKKLDSTTSCKSKICSQKVCFTDGYQHILLCN